MPNMTLAFDRSVRNIDADGRLHVKVSNISKATVNPYYGREIPDYKSLGLEADQIYKLLREPRELEKAAPTFNNIPLLSKHVPVSADDHQPDLVVGSTGTDAKFDSPYLTNSLVIWEAVAIAGIETREQCELSCAYRYTPVMQPGVFEGVAYDGIMTHIIGNHVALVESGRAGPDVVVSDSNPFSKELSMKQKRVSALMAALVSNLGPALATDAKIEEKDVEKVLIALDAESDEKDEKDEKKAVAEDDDDEDEKKDKPAEDEEEDDEEDKKAMDAAIAAARSEATADAVKRVQAIHKAEKEVQPIIGEVAAQDSAEAVYKLALDHAGIDVDGVHPSAYSALVRMHLKTHTAKPVMAQDAASASDFKAQFPNAVYPVRS